MDIPWKELLTAFIGTFVGAYAAFKLEHLAREREQRKQRAAEGNLALLTLFEMFSQLRTVQKESVEPFPDAYGRWVRMLATFSQTERHLGFEPSKLAFLFEYEDNKNLLPEILMEGRRFQLAIDMIRRRTHLMLEKVNPAFAKAGIKLGDNKPEEEFRKALDEALYAEINQLTEGIVKIVNQDVLSLKSTFDKLRRALLTLLRGQKFIQVIFDMPKSPEKPS